MPRTTNVKNANPALTYTLTDFISLRNSDNFTYRNYSILVKQDHLPKIEFLDHNLLRDYDHELNALAANVELSDEEFVKYRFSPDLLAYDVYGSTQLDFLVLYANDMIDPKEFNKRKIRLLYKSHAKALLNEIMNSDSGYLNQTRDDNKIYN